MEHEKCPKCPNPGCGLLLEPFQVPITGLPQMVSLTAWWCEKCHAPVRWHAPHPIVDNWHDRNPAPPPEPDLNAKAWKLLDVALARLHEMPSTWNRDKCIDLVNSAHNLLAKRENAKDGRPTPT